MNGRIGHRVAAAIALFLLPTLAAHACIFTYVLVGPDGQHEIRSGATATVQAGELYRIEIAMRENHSNCDLEAGDTMFLLEEGRWRVGRETQPLVLKSAIVWERTGSRSYTTAIEFLAAEIGTWTIDVIRECHRGGSHEWITIESR